MDRKEINPCYGCGSWDADMGCTMPETERSCARPVEDRGMAFFMAMDPPTCTHQEKQVSVIKGRPVFYDPPEVKAARLKLIGHLRKHAPRQPYRKGVQLMVKWCFPRGSHRDGEYRITKPDTDNLQKLLKDCMTASGFWRDDAQVASEIVEKFWADIPGIYVQVKELR